MTDQAGYACGAGFNVASVGNHSSEDVVIWALVQAPCPGTSPPETPGMDSDCKPAPASMGLSSLLVTHAGQVEARTRTPAPAM